LGGTYRFFVHTAPVSRTVSALLMGVLLCSLGGCASIHAKNSPTSAAGLESHPRLGNFSVSLAVKDLGASRAFYEKLGFRAVGGDPTKNWLILQNETSTIGLFQGMFDKNVLTFNPGWDRTGGTLPDFDDVRDIQRDLKARGLELESTADESTSGPASLMLLDPDENPILIDQHVPRPDKAGSR
jgi:catechol 2,3-dioxygenase-like lactoylglutathione lyase family enzyme